jgi:two-component system, OmpR family, response regulator PrrA
MGTSTTSTVSGTSRVSATPTVSAASGTASPDLQVQVVVIDGRHERGQLMGHVVEQSGLDVAIVGYADSSATAVEAVARLKPDAVVLEIQLPVEQGLDTISALRLDFPDLAIIVCSFRADAGTKRAALACGANAYLVKPFSLRDLRVALRPAPLN